MNTPQSRSEINSQQIQKMLDENAQILKAIIEAQNMKGKSMDIIQYQQVLHRNLIYLAGLADPNADLTSILPAPGGSNLLQSQRAPPPNQTVSSLPQNMTPPPSSMTTGHPVTGANMHMSSSNPNNVSGGQGQPQWGNTPSMSSMSSQSQYNMKGYAPAPWLSQGNPPNMPYGGGNMQRMQMDEQRRRHLLRLHQERLLRSRQMQQQHPSQPAGMVPPMSRGMYPPQVPPGGPAGYMGPPTQPGGMGQPPYTQPPPPGMPPPNMPMDM